MIRLLLFLAGGSALVSLTSLTPLLFFAFNENCSISWTRVVYIVLIVEWSIFFVLEALLLGLCEPEELLLVRRDTIKMAVMMIAHAALMGSNLLIRGPHIILALQILKVVQALNSQLN